ncbi:hypothetical protein AJ79_07357 [Helicocarpus griseus UAMH5409]|uniref:Cytochrome P450 monooxygenase n=1 Tax=Helicocarpus griseus UAMH5409 TaxID=1447875 RepID=A0A2B7X455_9EURO|nr:hypothetical protein AJ79_07357 [Helicocarpus griseus UAMH5409]
MRMGDGWRTSRGWLKDLLSPQYLHNSVGPSIHSSVLKLIEVWESKARITDESAMHRQVQYFGELDHSKIAVGTHNEVTFPRAPLHKFQECLHEVGDRMAAIYAGKWPPGLLSWWARYASPYYRKFFIAKDNFIRKHIDLAVQRSLNDEEAKTGIDHMVYQEQKVARKAGRHTVLGKQIMIDEACGNLIAGQSATGAALVWILKFLADYPAVQSKLRNELQTACAVAVQKNRLPTAAEIISTKLPYLDES